MGHMEGRIASRMSLGTDLQCVLGGVVPRFHQAWMVCERSSILAAFGGDKICLLSSTLIPAAEGSYKTARSATVPNLVLVQLLGQFLELLLPSSRSRNVAILGPSHSSH